jgi:hypothetical protein
MLAMAFSEEVYRRAANDQQIGNIVGDGGIPNSEGFGGELGPLFYCFATE